MLMKHLTCLPLLLCSAACVQGAADTFTRATPYTIVPRPLLTDMNNVIQVGGNSP